jgi:hypothetical protein
MAYSLPSISTVNGTFAISIQTDIAGLTAPTTQTVKSLGTRKHTAFITPSEQEVGSCTIELSEDYSTHSEGFYFKLFSESAAEDQSDIEFRIIFTPTGGSEAYWFFGFALPENTRWETLYIGAKRLRIIQLTLVESIVKIFKIDVPTWMDEVSNNAILTNAAVTYEPSYAISIRGLFSAMLSASALNASYDRDDTTFQYGTADLIWDYNAGAFDVSQLYVATQLVDVGELTYFDTAAASERLQDYYGTIEQLLGDLLKNFGCVLGFSYDLDTSRYKFILLQNWRAYSTALTFNTPKKESFSKSKAFVIDAVKVVQLTDTTKLSWVSRKYTSLTDVPTTEPPNYVQFEISFATPFNIMAFTGGDPGTKGNVLYGKSTELETGEASPTEIGNVKAWCYWITQYAEFSAIGSAVRMEGALALYYGRRLFYPFRMITCTYGTLNPLSSGTFSDITLNKRTSINDDVDTRDFYINTVKFDVENSEVEIEWLQENID